MSEEKSQSIIDKLRETKERLEKEFEPKRKYGAGEALKKYWEDVRSGKRELWSKNKVYDKATKKWVEKKEEPKPEELKKEEPKPEIKLEKKPFDKESEEIKKELEEKVTDEKVLEKKETEVEVVERKKELKGFELKGFFKGITSDWIIIGLVGILIIILGARYLSSKSSPQPPTPPQQKYREFDIGGRVIKIPVK
ncbi:MAG: hypothetical protein DDT21_02699 [Syntrophomonadaceae bacterium]|nr:hypothetical protein [Bacillota bacterium]